MGQVPDVVLLTFGAFGAAYLTCAVLAYFWIVRPYDRLVGERSIFLERGTPLLSALLRVFLYTQRIHKKPRPNWYDETLYGDFDFRRHATQGQIILSAILQWLGNAWLVSLAVFGFFRYCRGDSG